MYENGEGGWDGHGEGGWVGVIVGLVGMAWMVVVVAAAAEEERLRSLQGDGGGGGIRSSRPWCWESFPARRADADRVASNQFLSPRRVGGSSPFFQNLLVGHTCTPF